MTIDCDNLYEFLDVIESLVRRGLGFRADSHRYIITLTGAH